MRGEIGQASWWMFYVFDFFGSSPYPMRLVSLTPVYGRGEHKRYKLNNLPTIMQPCHCVVGFFLFWSLPPWGQCFFVVVVVLLCDIVLEKPGMGKIPRIQKPSSHLTYCGKYFEYNTTGNPPTLWRKCCYFYFIDEQMTLKATVA